mmetsp:Transcript_1563/g.3371  ORF Transcript_1563/g.3371 Transcript_1563/m.3371 type:complete len:207 (-) Transcript_1563:622-1242(-)
MTSLFVMKSNRHDEFRYQGEHARIAPLQIVATNENLSSQTQYRSHELGEEEYQLPQRYFRRLGVNRVFIRLVVIVVIHRGHQFRYARYEIRQTRQVSGIQLLAQRPNRQVIVIDVLLVLALSHVHDVRDQLLEQGRYDLSGIVFLLPLEFDLDDHPARAVTRTVVTKKFGDVLDEVRFAASRHSGDEYGFRPRLHGSSRRRRRYGE